MMASRDEKIRQGYVKREKENAKRIQRLIDKKGKRVSYTVNRKAT